MSSEIVVPETPNWLQELEAKREKRLKARLGHEAGAGAPCLKCEDKCPGLDLHFWRKCCKICKCSKEEHQVQDDDIYGWAQFQLLGSKPNKIKTKIVLPGKKDEIDLDWVPKGHNDTVEKYLKTLPPEQLPVKGSQAAQDRKQLLQKQIPIHDIDPTLCHELTEDELEKMKEYIAHVKQTSAGVGQLVSLSSIIRGKLHMLSPSEAAILASRYSKGIPVSEIVKLQSQNKAGSLAHNLDKMSLKHKTLPQYNPNSLNESEDVSNPLSYTKVHDREYPMYNNDINTNAPNAQFSTSLGPKQFNINPSNAQINPVIDPTIDPKYLQNPNFNSKNRPSNFVNPNSVYNQGIHRENAPFVNNPLDYNSENSAFVPYQKVSSTSKPGDVYTENSSVTDPRYAKSIPGQSKGAPFNMNPSQGEVENNAQIYENLQDLQKPSANMPNYAAGKYNTYSDTQSPVKMPKNVKDLAYSTYNTDTHGSKDIEDQENGFSFGKYRQPGSYSDNISKNNAGFRPIESGNVSSSQHFNPANPAQLLKPGDRKDTRDRGAYSAQFETINPHSSLSHSTGTRSGNTGGYSSPIQPNISSRSYPGLKVEDVAKHDAQYEPAIATNVRPGGFREYNTTLDPNSSYASSIAETSENAPSVNYAFDPNNPNYVYPHSEHLAGMTPGLSDPLNPKSGAFRPTGNSGLSRETSGHNHSVGSMDQSLGYQKAPGMQSSLEAGPGGVLLPNNLLKSDKKLSELHPSDLRINEDFVNPSQVNVGLIQDINYPEIKTASREVDDFYEEYSPDSIKEILNNVILPDCHYCKKPFEENEFAVSIDRANVLFHAGCFKCAGCNQILADNMYFYNKESDNIYCLRDYAKIRGLPRCKACDELIFTKEYCLAENSTFHLKHFCCTQCDMPLAGQDYLLEDEMPYCLPCFEQNKASKCSACGKIIKPDEVGCNLRGVHFHATDACFACKVCKTPLTGKKLLLRNDQLYCSHECYGKDQ
ncbi:uncharacterized protein LOC114327921 [Diabrotica virgifera virgifera]|uniref:Uncharacterized protein LOC114327921 n=1 Tax=Diabrotica virgifera virgifera TaxID=50390 RepID=A0A6P7FA67_DIAVI|nr:uncharacterized protein LOC114327921 [Diabrotica virgifera virgifera]